MAENLLHAWKRKGGSAAEKVRGGETQVDELKRLRREISQVKQEREALNTHRLLREGPLVSP
jgi:hypothetical protein